MHNLLLIMTDFLHPKNEFLQKVIAIIEENLSDEHFEVPDLAEQLNMSRSNLLRKIKSITGFSVSVYIRQVRLYHAREMLKGDSFTISEVSYKVGFSSTSYFTKCFREAFGYPPGEERRRPQPEIGEEDDIPTSNGLKAKVLIIAGAIIVIVSALLISRNIGKPIELDKSIAVLPFKNDSDDSSNVYIINGLLETILDNLQKIEDLDVTSRTTVEKYRGVNKTIPELARELRVSYFVEGSGQKVGDQILLTIQLIDAKNDRHVWSQQYEREAKDIFKLQMEVAKNIAQKIEAIITPDEQRRIEKIPTENLVAYDFFLKGSDLLNEAESNEPLYEAIDYFQRAIKEDSKFAHPYAYIAICYYYLDIYLADKQFGQAINTYADKALLFDEELPESLLAKALFYMQDQQYELAADYFEKTLEYSPSSARVHNYLSDIYANYIPNTEKYLVHAIQGIRAAVSDQDSSTASFTYLHLSNALAQTGFINDAEKYVQASLVYNPENLFAEYLYIYIRLAQNFNMERAKNELLATLNKDTTRLDIIQEVAKVCYTMEDYKEAWKYYRKFISLKEMWGLDIYHSEDVKIAFVLDRIGEKGVAGEYY
ncbi:MAG: helix-turn-helix domain-containing protein, partial [Ekhidna sp.]